MTNPLSRTTQSIPNDVVQEIFSQFSSSLNVYNAGDFPWYLGHICAAWRTTFLSMRLQFWKMIALEWPKWRRREPDRFPLPWYTQRVMDMLKFFLQCNQGSPFSFALCTMFTGYTEEEAQDVNRVLLILVSESTRWENASLDLRASMLPTLYRIKHHLPRLQSLELILSADDRSHYFVPELYADIFETTQLLTSITVRHLSRWKFDWSSLTFVCVDCALDNNLLYGALSLAVRLRGLQIDVPFFSFSLIPATGPSIKLPCLIYLSVPSSRFLTMLETPALVDLKISNKQRESTPEPNIIDFLHRSSCKLLHLCIVHHDASIVKRILPHTPDIRYLCFIYVKNLSDILLWLAKEKSEVPHLETFRISEETWMKDDDIDMVSHTVASRAPTVIDGNGIKHLTIHKYESFAASQVAAVERLISTCRVHGVELQFPSHQISCRFCSLVFSSRTY